MTPATILDGRTVAAEIKSELRNRIHGRRIGLGTILVGSDPASASYVDGKHRDCAEVGITSIRRELPGDISESSLLKEIEALNSDKSCTGFIVQLPLPKAINASRIIEAIDPQKDADGLHPLNLGRLVMGEPAPLPCTPLAIIELARRYSIAWAGKDVVIIGRGMTVGRPLSLMLSRKSENATVTLMHSASRDISSHTRRADIVIAALGKAEFLRAEMIKPGAVVFDVGLSRVNGQLIGDVHREVSEVASAITPVPGGVGPMTRAMLLQNVVSLAEHQ
jgi:methylenetetrahydrofolate dehydrogenase (NADP+)/methenyltetrahydrofolate cyclohydrolase